eukprot:5204710-Alexandrium_andersonii.AAC.1
MLLHKCSGPHERASRGASEGGRRPQVLPCSAGACEALLRAGGRCLWPTSTLRPARREHTRA